MNELRIERDRSRRQVATYDRVIALPDQFGPFCQELILLTPDTPLSKPTNTVAARTFPDEIGAKPATLRPPPRRPPSTWDSRPTKIKVNLTYARRKMHNSRYPAAAQSQMIDS